MHVLITDDEGNLRRMLRALLEEEGYQVSEAESAESALAQVEGLRPDVILLDLVLPGMSGLDALAPLAERAPGVPVVMMSGEARLADAVEATRRGAFHFIEKPLTPEAVVLTVRSALEVSRARDLTRVLREELGPDARLVGESPAMQEARERIRKVAPTHARVLITGESGTGKELAAAAIHGLSDRKDHPFLRVNSAAIPRDLVETEMFGHERGAFTGATARRRGRFELAHRGTLFLDEVGDLGGEAQAKLLRALESGVIQRIGGNESVEVDVRVVAATNQDLRREVEAGRFREDLLFRLEGVPLHLPPLRERPEDIPPLLEHLRERLRRREGVIPPEVAPDGLAELQAYAWPGNVRELYNIVERLAILHPAKEVSAAEVRDVLPGHPEWSREEGPEESEEPSSLRERLDRYEAHLIRRAMAATDGNVAAAARRLRTDRANLYRRMKRLGIRDGGQG